MRKFAMAFLFCLISPIVNAQQIIELSKSVKCSEAEQIMNFFKENYKELPIWVGKTISGTHVVLLSNKETRSWTIIEYDSKLGCALAAGESSSNPNIETY